MAWKIIETEMVPMRPNRVHIVLETDEPFIQPAAELSRTMFEERFAAALADCAELTVYRSRAGQDDAMRADLNRVELELQKIIVEVQIAKSDLTGSELAKCLVELERQRKAAEPRVAELREGTRLFEADVERDRQAAYGALVKLVHTADQERYRDAREQMATASEALRSAINEHMDAVAELMYATRPSPVDPASLHEPQIQEALAGTLQPSAAPADVAPAVAGGKRQRRKRTPLPVTAAADAGGTSPSSEAPPMPTGAVPTAETAATA